MFLSHFFSHLQNSQTARILVIHSAPSKHLFPILDILQDFGYIRGYRLLPNGSSSGISLGANYQSGLLFSSSFPKLEILLKYKNQKPAISRILSISKPSRRFYISANHLSRLFFSPPSLFDPSPFMHGLFILSTSKGLMSHFTAHKLHIGGEVLCHVS
jgi:small subunit ribosomal protein S8